MAISVSLLSRLNTVIRREGGVFLVRKAYLRLVNLFVDYRCYFIFDKLLEEKSQRQLAASNSVLHIIESVEQLQELTMSGHNFSTLTTISKLSDGIERGGTLFALFIEKELAHTSWVVLNSKLVAYDWIFQRVHYPGAAYIGPCDTPEKFRGLGLYPYTLTQIFNFLVDRNVRKAVINTRMTNASSIKGIVKAGFTLMSKAHFLKLGGREYFWEHKV